MKKIPFLLTTFIITLVLISFSCSQQNQEPASRSNILKFSEDNFVEIINKIKEDPTMTREQLTLFTNGIARMGTQTDSLVGKTVGEIIQLQKDYLRRSALTSMLSTSMNIHHGFGLLGWEPVEQEGKQFDVFKYAIQNKSDKNLEVVEGLLKFYTNNNQLIRIYPIRVEQSIGVDSTQQFESTFRYDSTNKSANMLRRLMTSETGRAIPIWQPTLIKLGDGSSISLGEDEEKEESPEAKE